MSFQKTLSQPFNVLWRSALVKLPRAVPKEILYWTCPNGPHPIVLELPSPRGKHKIPVYVFVPRSITPARRDAVPVVIDFHGGGFWMGSCMEQAPFCTMLANELDAVVISVDYRMAPVDAFPAAQEDADDVAYAILHENAPGYAKLREGIRSKILSRWKDANKKSSSQSVSKIENIPSVAHIDLDKSKIAVTGFSSGGNLAMNLGVDVAETENQKAWPSPFSSDYPHPFALVLYYPAIDLVQLPSERTRPPKLPVSKGWWAELNDMLAPSYLPRDRAAEFRASPGLAPIETSLHKQARLQFVLAELDALTPQNDEWISKASKAGRSGDIVVHRYQNQTHGWTQIPETWLDDDQRRTREDAFNKTVEFIKNTWAGDDLGLLRTPTTSSLLTVGSTRPNMKSRKSRRPWKRTPKSSREPSRETSPEKQTQNEDKDVHD
jgi:acetyl esterase/lipase